MTQNVFDNFIYSNSQYSNSAQIFSEFLEFYYYCLDMSSRRNFMEIGTKGGFSFSMLAFLFDNKKISVDLPSGPFGGPDYNSMVERNNQLQSKFGNVYGILGNSQHQKTLDEVTDVLDGEKLDLLFIDGDHTYEGVKSDYEMYNHLVNSGGYIAFHDVIYAPRWQGEAKCDVYKFWEELRGNKITISHFQKNHSLRWGGIGLLLKE